MDNTEKDMKANISSSEPNLDTDPGKGQAVSKTRCQRCGGSGTHMEYVRVEENGAVKKKKFCEVVCVACDGEGTTNLPYTTSNPRWLIYPGKLTNRHYRRTAASTYGIRRAKKEADRLNAELVAQQELDRVEASKAKQALNVSDM